MIPAALASTSAIATLDVGETTDSTTMTHGTDGGKVPATGFRIATISFGSLANTVYRSSALEGVYTGSSILLVRLSGNRAQTYFDRIVCVLGTFNQSTATYSHNATDDYTQWYWGSAGTFASSGTSTVDLIY